MVGVKRTVKDVWEMYAKVSEEASNARTAFCHPRVGRRRITAISL
jgi:hypothetical protein